MEEIAGSLIAALFMIILLAAIPGLVFRFIYKRKGFRGVKWAVLAFFPGINMMFGANFFTGYPDFVAREIAQRAADGDALAACPDCGELVQPRAARCWHCGCEMVRGEGGGHV